MDLDNITEPMEFDSRSAAESGIPNTIDKEDNVELEKSNVLLMGPTGSGIIPSKALWLTHALHLFIFLALE